MGSQNRSNFKAAFEANNSIYPSKRAIVYRTGIEYGSELVFNSIILTISTMYLSEIIYLTIVYLSLRFKFLLTISAL